MQWKIVESDEEPTSLLIPANNLDTLSGCLSRVSQHQEALSVICEAEDIQQSELRNPATESYRVGGITNLAAILNKKSTCLAN